MAESKDVVGERIDKKCNDVVEIADISKDDKCEELKSELRTAISSTKDIVENLNEGLMCLTTDVEQIQEKLSRLKETFIMMFDVFAKNVTDAAISYRDETSTKWTTKKRECESQITDLNKTLDTIDDIVKNGTASGQFNMEQSMPDVVKHQSNDAFTLCTDLKVLNVECNFDEQFEKFKTKLMTTLTSEVFKINYSVPKKTKLELIKSIYLEESRDDIGEPLLYGLDFLFDGRLVGVDIQNGKCLVYDENLKLQSSFKLPYDHPLGIVAVSNEEVTITASEEGLAFLHISNTSEITLNRTCKVKATCLSISMKDNENFVVSCFDDNIPVRMVSMSGEEKTFDVEFPSKEYSTEASSCTYIRGQDKLVMCDNKSDKIYIYDIKTGEKTVVKDELIKEPCDVTVGPCDHVFVCSQKRHAIVEITPGGRVLSEHQVDMWDPRSVAVSKDGRKLAVSNARVRDRMLTLYEIKST